MKPSGEKLRSVLVSYEPSRAGDAALSHAVEVARETGATLTVASVAPQERTDVGCAHCHANARAWNEQLCLLAHQRLSTAARTIGDTPDVHYLAACGPKRQVLAQAARQCAADLVVMPRPRAEPLRRRLRLSAVDDLSRRGSWQVVTAPRAA